MNEEKEGKIETRKKKDRKSVSVYNIIFMTELGWKDFTTQMILPVQIYPTRKKKKYILAWSGMDIT